MYIFSIHLFYPTKATVYIKGICSKVLYSKVIGALIKG